MQVGLKQRVHDILEVGEGGGVFVRVVQGALLLLILLNVTAVVLETVASIAAAHGVFFLWFEIFSVAVFTVEYVLRLGPAPAITATAIVIPSPAACATRARRSR